MYEHCIVYYIIPHSVVYHTSTCVYIHTAIQLLLILVTDAVYVYYVGTCIMHYDPTDDVDTHKLGSGVHPSPPSLYNTSRHTTSSSTPTTPTTPTPHTIHTTHNIHNKNNTILFLDIPLYINAEVHIENVMFIGHHFYPQVSKKTLVTYNVTLSNVRGTGLSVFKAHGPKKAPREMMVSICLY